MEKKNQFQIQLDKSYLKQYEFERKIDDLSKDYRKLQNIQENVMESQGEALYNFKEILSLKLSISDKLFYQDLIYDIDANTRKMEYSFEEELLEIKNQSKIYQEKLDHLLDDRKKILKELN
ncbi:hypothetical protein [uncultured Streptococcus sp.]|uniref:hypothetical protein n=1 Tax=uncultured Streptococcus sp. TaxID=83427 RepID=UPI0026141CE7|nr:hypothetical protein [uncultured Streptococcus sp.]